MNLPRMLRPLPGRPPTGVTPAAVSDVPVTLVTGPPGAYAAESLAALLEGRGRWQRAVWLRTSVRPPASIAAQLADACRHRWGGRDAGVDASLPAALEGAPPGATVVLELSHRTTSSLGRLLDGVRPVLVERGVSLVVIGRHRTDRLAVPHDAYVAADVLTGPAAMAASCLRSDAAERLVAVTSRRPALAHDVGDAAGLWPPGVVGDAVMARLTWRGVVDHLTATLVAAASSDQRAALEQCVASGYCHPRVVTGALAMEQLRPWVVPLEQGWGCLRPVWRPALVRHLRTPPIADRRHRPPQPATTAPRADVAARAGIRLEARVLGAFELRIDGVGVDASPGHRGYAVLRYLLARPAHAASRDEILEQFWPDVDVEVARNRLQVAISGVRRALRAVTATPVVEYRDGSYRIADGVAVDLDVGRFERALRTAAAAEAAGRDADALDAYTAAVRLWRGDYASETPFEQWSMLSREHLRLRYIDALDHLSRLQLDAGLVRGCIVTAHRLLDVDPSREDVHRLLMRCYAGQGRIHQALRQYELCTRALRVTVDAEPSAATQRLREAVVAGRVAA